MKYSNPNISFSWNPDIIPFGKLIGICVRKVGLNHRVDFLRIAYYRLDPQIRWVGGVGSGKFCINPLPTEKLATEIAEMLQICNFCAHKMEMVLNDQEELDYVFTTIRKFNRGSFMRYD